MKSKLPAIQWYPRDWINDMAVQSLTFEERGIWWEILQHMHQSDDRGKMSINGTPMTDEEISQVIHCDLAKLCQTLSKILSKSLAKRGILGELYNERMVYDDKIRKIRAKAGAEGGKQKASKNLANVKQKATPSSSSSSSSSSSLNKKGSIERKFFFTKPTAEQVEEYAQTLSYPINGAAFVAHYDSKGWVIGTSPMKDWKAAVRTWKIKDAEKKGATNAKKETRNPWHYSGDF